MTENGGFPLSGMTGGGAAIRFAGMTENAGFRQVPLLFSHRRIVIPGIAVIQKCTMPAGFRVTPERGNSWALFVSIREGNNIGVIPAKAGIHNIGVIPAKAGIHEVLQKLQNAGFPLSRE
jgi:hypothetical protein